MSRNAVNKESKESSSNSDKVYSTIGNEGPTTSTEETGHRRSTKEKKKVKAKHKKATNENKLQEEKEVNATAVEKAEIAAFHEKDVDEDVVSKKDKVHH